MRFSTPVLAVLAAAGTSVSAGPLSIQSFASSAGSAPTFKVGELFNTTVKYEGASAFLSYQLQCVLITRMPFREGAEDFVCTF